MIESLIKTVPLAMNADRAAETRAAQGWAKEAFADLLAGAAGASPYLAGLIAQEGGWLETITLPRDAYEAELARLKAIAPDQVTGELRRGKRRIALLTALQDLGGMATLEEVTGQLTGFADLAVSRALDQALRHELRRKKLPGKGEDDLTNACGMVVMAMGKMGAGELNYSSDIDLICLFDAEQYDPDHVDDARASLIRATRRMVATLNDLTAEGYVFRTDLRLRPDPSVTPVCISMEAAERYYESVGRTWERAAHIKARPCAGDLAAGDAYLDRLRPFVWRRHLDFAAIEDAYDMQLRIREHKAISGKITLPGHDMKLGRGGIREIEFFTQTRQIIAGGRAPDLRQRETVTALAALAEKDWIPADAAQTLTRHYRAHRQVEHRLQMIHDAQTHSLPTKEVEFQRLAALFGHDDVERLKTELFDRLSETHALTEQFYAREGDDKAQIETTESEAEIIARWSSYPALRSSRAQSIFRRLRPEILSRMKKAARFEEALSQFDAFLAALPAGVQLFSLFEANLQLIDLLVDICGTAPALAVHLSKNVQVLDAVIDGRFFDPWPDKETLRSHFEAQLEAIDDYEQKLGRMRQQMQEWHFRIGVHHLRGLIKSSAASAQYADLAEVTVQAIWPSVQREFARKHGAAPGRGAAVIAMGSLGAGLMNAQSDLDLIVVYDADGVEASDGKRPLASQTYYARLTQSLLTALTAPMAEGRLYEVDMRLRPSGRQGPVATSLTAFKTYQREEAWTWEHLAQTRARSIAGAHDVCAAYEAFRLDLIAEKSANPSARTDVADMRMRLANAKPSRHDFEAKRGQGGLQDIELIGQLVALLAKSPERQPMLQIADAERQGILDRADIAVMETAYRLLWPFRMAEKLLTDQPLDLEKLGQGGQEFMLRVCHCDDLGVIAERLADVKSKVNALTIRMLG